ncbi:MAG: lysine exporter LysO family protein [Fusobacteriaceae bacterium]
MLGISLSVIIGVIFGLFYKSTFILENIDSFIDLGLCLLLFFVGIDIGKNSSIFSNLKKYGKRIWFLPISVVVGTLLGGGISSLFTSLNWGESVTVGAGLGWYSLSAIEISKVSPSLGSVAFLTNVFRELMAIFSIPFIAKRIGYFEAISSAGAPAMDTVLPIINKYTTSDTAIISFFTGVVLSALVPIIVPLFISLYNIGG